LAKKPLVLFYKTSPKEMDETMIDAEAVNHYLTWKLNNELYPPRYTPEEYVEYLIMSDARDRLRLLADYLTENGEINDPYEILSEVQSIVFDPIKKENK
jgi:hypothetical protein